METKKESHYWWFNSYNTARCSPWLESTLAELNDKTKTMLKLIEEDADSFAQRAEMYYKKRPELISMVEDFYRTHRSLAERYDQLKSDRVIRVKAPLRHSLSLPKEDYEYVLDSIDSFKPFDSLTDMACTYEDAAESEVDDPDQENGDDKQFAAVECYDELMKLRGELDRLREENEVQKNVIKQKDYEKDEIVNRLSYNIKELKEETIAARKENLGAVTKDTCEVIIPFDEVTNVKTEKKQVKKKESEVIEVMKKFEAEKTKSMYLEDELARKKEENVQVTMHLTETKFELAKVKEEMTRMNEQLKDTHVKKDEETKDMTRQVKQALTEEDETIRQLKEVLIEKDEMIRQLKEALTEDNEGKREAMKQLKDVLAEKLDAIKQLKDALVQNDEERCEAIRQLKNALTQKDEEKREAIRQLSVAMEMIREESKLFKKLIVNNSPRKSNANAADFQVFKGVKFGNLFNHSSKC